MESDLLIKDGHAAIGLAYAAASAVDGILAVWAGLWAARAVPLPHQGART